MDIHNREDISQLNELSKFCDLENVPFGDVMRLLVGFISTELLSKNEIEKLCIDNTVASIVVTYGAQARKFLTNEISVEELENCRISAWENFDCLANGSHKKLLRVVIFCLYDRDSAEYELYGSSAIFETFFSTLLDLGSGYCERFVRYAKKQKQGQA
mgnify:CR=1 FL=1